MNFAAVDLNLLRVFDAMMLEMSTVRAGGRIGLSQPAVSSALGRLRHMIGDELFVREGNRMVPTARALQLQGPLRSALRQMEEALNNAAGFDPATSRRAFRLSGSDYFSSLLMPKLAARLARAAPSLTLQMIDRPVGDMFGLLSDGHCDIALHPASACPEWILRKSVFRSWVVCVAHKDHPVLAAHAIEPGTRIPADVFCRIPQVILSMDGSRRGSIDAMLDAHGLERQVAMSVPHFHAVALACVESSFLGNLPVHFARLVAERLDLNIFLTPFDPPIVEVCMFWHRRLDREPANRWLRAEIARALCLQPDETLEAAAAASPLAP